MAWFEEFNLEDILPKKTNGTSTSQFPKHLTLKFMVELIETLTRKKLTEHQRNDLVFDNKEIVQDLLTELNGKDTTVLTGASWSRKTGEAYPVGDKGIELFNIRSKEQYKWATKKAWNVWFKKRGIKFGWKNPNDDWDNEGIYEDLEDLKARRNEAPDDKEQLNRIEQNTHNILKNTNEIAKNTRPNYGIQGNLFLDDSTQPTA